MYQDLLKKQLKHELLRVQIFWSPGNNKAADKLHHSLRKTGLVYPGFKKKNIFYSPELEIGLSSLVALGGTVDLRWRIHLCL